MLCGVGSRSSIPIFRKGYDGAPGAALPTAKIRVCNGDCRPQNKDALARELLHGSSTKTHGPVSARHNPSLAVASLSSLCLKRTPLSIWAATKIRITMADI